jgi:hypothetical protein
LDDGWVEFIEEDGPPRTAESLGDAIVRLVGMDGQVVLELPADEFDRIVRVTPQKPDAVAFDVMVGHDEGFAAGLVVVHAHTPPLGWWTFDDESHGDGHAAAWSVIKHFVVDGGEALRGRRSTNLLNVLGVRVSGPLHNGGVRPRHRRTPFAPYRNPAPEPQRPASSQDEAEMWFSGVTARTEMERLFVHELRVSAADWGSLGLSPERSIGVAAARPLLGVEVPHHLDALRWLWILLIEGKQNVRIECSWGDNRRLNDWGPSEGDVDFSFPRATATCRELVGYASTWVREQASRQR